jgi:hypothetical protein
MASATIMGILHFDEVEILFPVWPLFEQWRRAITDFDPAHSLIRTKSCITHITEILAFGDGTRS